MNYDALARKYSITIEHIEESLERARRSLIPVTKRIEVVERGRSQVFEVTRRGVGPLKIQFGAESDPGPVHIFHHFSFAISDRWEKYSVIAKADLTDGLDPSFQSHDGILIRTDSGCETGQLFGDRTCECRDQLIKSLRYIADLSQGMVVHIPHQDGRGLGLPFKLGTLRLQHELGVNTVESSSLLDPNGERDTRTYAGVIAILKFFGIATTVALKLVSNNPKKSLVFVENGWREPEEVDIHVPPTDLTRDHLAAKQQELGHRAPGDL